MKMPLMTVSDFIKIIHDFASPALAYDWDNVGFLLGDAALPVKKVLLCLDITNDSVDYAVKNDADLIISHHPMIFKPIKKITNPLFLKLIKNDIAVISAHTNLDITKGGVNHRLAELLQLSELEILSSSTGSDHYQVAVYVPASHLQIVKKAVFDAGAGKFGNYSHCCAEFEGNGQFKPLEGSDPFQGKQDKLENISEVKLEFFTESFYLPKVLSAMHKAHPYETPVYAVYPQKQDSPNFGLGLIGSLPQPVSISSFAHQAKHILKSPRLNLWLADKKPDADISRIAVCGGSGGSLISLASNRCDLFLSGEFGYHNMMDSPLPLIEAGHFHTEYPVLQVIKQLIDSPQLEVEIMPLTLHETTARMLYF
jgi:dinuclear metal center YbgI/SA1388 family protein